jgi:hypothetical protein
VQKWAAFLAASAVKEIFLRSDSNRKIFPDSNRKIFPDSDVEVFLRFSVAKIPLPPAK